MPKKTAPLRSRLGSLTRFSNTFLVLAVGVAGCSSQAVPYAGQLPGESSTNRRVTLWEVAAPPGQSLATQPAATQPVASQPAATQPATTQTAATQPVATRPVTTQPGGTQVAATQPVASQPTAAQPIAARPASTRPVETVSPPGQVHHLNSENIVRLVYEKSPLVRASRESMIAAQHGLEEFRANLSRFEPFVEANSTVTNFPERRDSKGLSGEATGGLEKETFDGAVVRLEGGMSAQRVRFGEVAEDQEAVEDGRGGLVRARVEVPFAGSRKRQDRIINQAFQESSARKAVLNYLSNYSSYVTSALSYYRSTLYYLGYMRAYQRMLGELDRLMQDPRVREGDRSRLESTAGDARVLIESYDQYYRTYLLYLLQYAGIGPEEQFELDEPSADEVSRYYERTLTRQGREELLAEAYENNPQFHVLEDAIKDSELKRDQAIQGKLDVTAFGQATRFGFGSATFDDRVGGWQADGGVTLRLNDQRVLTASQKKAEAEIRGFRAQIEAQQLAVQQDIATESNTLRSRIESRAQILENIEKDRAQFKQRRRTYLERTSETLTIDDVLTSLSLLNNSECQLLGNVYYTALAENQLMGATGEVYRLAGMKMVDNGSGVKLPADK